MNDATAKAQAKLAKLSIEDLIRAFEGTDEAMDKAAERRDGERYSHVARVRGWLMDELEKRDGKAFDRWVDSETMDNEALRAAYQHPAGAMIGLVSGVGFVMKGLTK